jgi:hypothetical protein
MFQFLIILKKANDLDKLEKIYYGMTLANYKTEFDSNLGHIDEKNQRTQGIQSEYWVFFNMKS